MWPILGRVVDPVISSPFVIGIYTGYLKPKDVNEYLKEVLNEGKELESSSRSHPKVHIQFIICDSPARSYVLQIKSHSGYFPCNVCVIEGAHVGKMYFSDVCMPRRTDGKLRCQLQEHHIGISPF